MTPTRSILVSLLVITGCSSANVQRGPAGQSALPRAPVASVSLDEILLSPERPRISASREPAITGSTHGDGSLDPNLVVPEIRARIPLIRQCYDRSLTVQRRANGRVVVHFTIGLSGRTERATAAGEWNESDLDTETATNECIAGVFRQMTFPAPSGGPVDFSFPFNFTPGDDVPRAAPAAASPPAPEGAIDPVAAHRILVGQRARLFDCYLGASQPGSAVPRSLRARLLVGADGTVVSTHIQPDGSGEPDAMTATYFRCVETVLRAVTFPPSASGPVRLLVPMRVTTEPL